MNTKHYLVISGIIGGVIGSLLTAMLVSPVTADRDIFGEIECRRLKVVDMNGVPRIIVSASILLDRNSTKFNFDNADTTRVRIYGDESGGYVVTKTEKGLPRAVVACTTRDGPVVEIYDEPRRAVSIQLDEHGGYVQVKGKGEGAAVMGINEYGNGAMSTWDKNGYRQ